MSKKTDHFVFPDDPEKEPRPGWGPFKFDWLMKDFKEAVAWHDEITKDNSFAERVGIPNWRVAKAWREMLEERAKAIPKAGLMRRTAWGAGFIVAKLNRYFYRGPLGKEPPIQGDPIEKPEPWE